MTSDLCRRLTCACLVVVLVGGCRSSEDLAAEEADARARTCVSLIERMAGSAAAAEREIDDADRPGADWRLLVEAPARYYGELLEVVSSESYLEIADQARTTGAYRHNSAEMKAGCPLDESP